MKFNALAWSEVKANEQRQAPQGRLWLRCSRQAAFFVEVEGSEVLAGVGFEIDVEVAYPVKYRVEAIDGEARVFVYAPRRITHEPSGEVFTNIDRKPMESGSVLAVREATRQMQLVQRQMMREMRLEAASLKAAKAINAQMTAPPAQEEKSEAAAE